MRPLLLTALVAISLGLAPTVAAAYDIPPLSAKDLPRLMEGAEKGDRNAQTLLGFLYDTGGEGVPQNEAESLKWYRKAADQGEPDAQQSLCISYFKGLDVAQDYAESLKWCRKAAEQGQALAMNELGIMYLTGHGLPQDNAEAFTWFQKSAEKGEFIAQTYLGTMYYRGDGVPQDYTEALKWYRKAAEQGYALAQAKVGAMYGLVRARAFPKAS